MSDISIVVDDAQVRQLLDRAPSRIDMAMRLGMKDATSHLEDKLRTYPPPPDPIQGPQRVPVRSFTTRGGVSVRILSRSAHGKGVTWASAASLRYVRTYTLQKSWHTTVTGSGLTIEGKVFSDHTAERYARYVQDRDRQARVHVGRWTNTVQGVSEREAGAVQQMFDARIRAALG